jgi:hypothetical protein
MFYNHFTDQHIQYFNNSLLFVAFERRKKYFTSFLHILIHSLSNNLSVNIISSSSSFAFFMFMLLLFHVIHVACENDAIAISRETNSRKEANFYI